MSEQLERLRDVLLAQCAATEVYSALSIAHRSGAGVVVSTRQRREVLALADLAGRREIPLLVDAARYTGATRRRASELFDPSWLRVQREAELPVLSDSGYVGEYD